MTTSDVIIEVAGSDRRLVTPPLRVVESSPPPFVPHRLLAGFHRQTIAASLLRIAREPQSVIREVRVNENNSLRTRCTWHEPDRVEQGRPVMVLLHGMGGSAGSPYMRGTASKAFDAGFDVVRINQRGADGTAALADRPYNAALVGDVAAVFDALAAEGRGPFALVGFSLGGNCALRFAGLEGEALRDRGVVAVAAVSPSVDLPTCGDAIDNDPRVQVYKKRFVRELVALAEEFHVAGKGHGRAGDLRGITSLRDFDDLWTAPLHGFGGADEYYERTSALPVLENIAVPTLVMHARDDHLVPGNTLEELELPSYSPVRRIITDSGGHCAYIARRGASEDGVGDSDRMWAEHRVIRFAVRALI